jgi:hypothetical protein
MNACFRSGFVISLLSALAVSSSAQGRDFTPHVVQAANLDGGGLSADEWRTFVGTLDVAADGTLSRPLVLARVISASWDFDSDGTTTFDDLVALFGSLDTDENDGLTSTEIRAGSTSWRRLMSNAVLFDYLVQAVGFDEGDVVEVSRDMWSSLAMACDPDTGRVQPELVVEWIAALQAAPPSEDLNAITSGVYLLSLDAALDANFDGTLTLGDLDSVFRNLDTDDSGDLSLGELGGGRRLPPATPTTVVEISDIPTYGDPLMPWQRTLEDALVLSQQTGKPLLICVNVDGESASEVLARFQYCDPDFVAKAQGFIPLIVSPDEHNPREYNDRGRRIPDPKFGRVINSEHVDIEPIVFERYFGGQRVAPRHIGVSPEGKILFDVKLVDDLSIIDRRLEEHGVFGTEIPDAALADERDLLGSPDALHRDRLEAIFANGDERTRVRLASLCLSAARDVQHPEILRMALLDPAERVRRQAVWTAVQHPSAVPTNLLLPVFSAADPARGQLSALVDAVRRMEEGRGDESRRLRAKRLDRVFTGLQRPSLVLDVARWSLALAFAPQTEERTPTVDQTNAVARRLTELEARLQDSPGDRELNLLFADTLMRLARIQMISGGNPTYLFEDVRRAASSATSPEEPNGRALGFMAWSSYLLADLDDAVEYAAQALPLLRADAASPLTAQVLQVFAKGRLGALYKSMADQSEWPIEWIADIRDVYEVLLVHPSVTESQVVDYVRFLEAIEAFELEETVVRRGILLFPNSTDLHASLRAQVLRDHGASALVHAYDGIDPPPTEAAAFAWYSGLATLVAAERHVQNRDTDNALVAYHRSVERFRESYAQQPKYKRSATHYIALALAGSARLHMDKQRWEDAVEAMSAGLIASPGSASSKDGLGNTPAATAKTLHRVLVREGRATEASALREVIDTAIGS